MKPLTQDQVDSINLVLFEIFNRPELLHYMRQQLTDNFWKGVNDITNKDSIIDSTVIR